MTWRFAPKEEQLLPPFDSGGACGVIVELGFWIEDKGVSPVVLIDPDLDLSPGEGFLCCQCP